MRRGLVLLVLAIVAGVVVGLLFREPVEDRTRAARAAELILTSSGGEARSVEESMRSSDRLVQTLQKQGSDSPSVALNQRLSAVRVTDGQLREFIAANPDVFGNRPLAAVRTEAETLLRVHAVRVEFDLEPPSDRMRYPDSE